jgi:hypothetical protein
MYSTSCHQIACGSDLRIAHYSSMWRLMITSEWPFISGSWQWKPGTVRRFLLS